MSFILSSYLIDSLAGYVGLGWKCFPGILKALLCCFLTFKVAVESSAVSEFLSSSLSLYPLASGNFQNHLISGVMNFYNMLWYSYMFCFIHVIGHMVGLFNLETYVLQSVCFCLWNICPSDVVLCNLIL